MGLGFVELKKSIWSKKDIAAHSLEYGGFVLYPNGVEWNDAETRHFQVDFRKLFDTPYEFRLGIANEMHKKLKEQAIPKGYNLKIVGIPAAGTTTTTDMSLVYGVPAARLRKEAFSYVEDAENYGKNINDTGTLAKHYEQRASAKGRTASRGKKDLFEEGSLQEGDALWFVDNISSRTAKSKITACNLVRDDAPHKGLLEGKDYTIEGSIVIVSNSPNAQKVHEENNLKFVYLWTLPNLVNDILQSAGTTDRNTISKGLQGKINDFNNLYPTIIDEIEELGW